MLPTCHIRNAEDANPAGRAVARAMKTRATARAERKKPQPDSTHRGIFFNGAGDGLNRRVRGPTRAVAQSSSHIEKLVTQYSCVKNDLKILPPNALREFRSTKSRISLEFLKAELAEVTCSLLLSLNFD
jgi:hypothetical protein